MVISRSMSSKPVQIFSASSWLIIPCSESIVACAFEPAMSCLYMRLSTGSDAPKRWVNSFADAVKRPDHSAIKSLSIPYICHMCATRGAVPSSRGAGVHDAKCRAECLRHGVRISHRAPRLPPATKYFGCAQFCSAPKFCSTK